MEEVIFNERSQIVFDTKKCTYDTTNVVKNDLAYCNNKKDWFEKKLDNDEFIIFYSKDKYKIVFVK